MLPKRAERRALIWKKTAALRPSGKRRKIACKITDKKKTVHKGGGLREEASGGDREETVGAAEPAQSQKKRAGAR